MRDIDQEKINRADQFLREATEANQLFADKRDATEISDLIKYEYYDLIHGTIKGEFCIIEGIWTVAEGTRPTPEQVEVGGRVAINIVYLEVSRLMLGYVNIHEAEILENSDLVLAHYNKELSYVGCILEAMKRRE